MESNKKIRTLKNNKNIIKLKDGENIWLNKTAIFYGANASGKTNILKGLDFLKFFILNSFKFSIEGGIKDELLKIERNQRIRVFLDNFLLDEDSIKNDVSFEIEFLINKVKYRYFLKVNNEKVIKEKLFYFENSKEIFLINREELKLSIKGSKFGFEGEEQESWPRNNQSFISLLADRDSKGEFLATKIIKFFRGINYINSETDLRVLTIPMLEDENAKKTILDFIKSADINIDDINQEQRDYNENDGGEIFINGQRILPSKVIDLNFIHPVYKDEKKVGNIGFKIEKQESLGTKRLFGILGPILNTIKNNGILLIDEVDTHMHFLLIENLIKAIHGVNEDGKNNIGNAQFIFNTHNLDLMDLELFKKDQIYFTSKDYYGATEMYALDDFKDIQIRNNSDIKKAYKLGAFGAIPILSDFNF